jgi:hypothetical protein
MPVLAAHGPVDFYELFQNGSIAAFTFGGKACRVVITTIYIVVMLIIWVLRPEELRANRACEMLDVIFFVYRKVRGSISSEKKKVWDVPHAMM